jgi:hypothetical protein
MTFPDAVKMQGAPPSPAAVISTVVRSRFASAIWDATARFHISSYTLASSG